MTRRHHLLTDRAAALAEEEWSAAAYLDDGEGTHDGDQLDREERAALRRVAGLSTELEDVTEVEYRQLRLRSEEHTSELQSH